jgi:hypothetical protein
MGTPTELLALGGAYADLVRVQQQPGAVPIEGAFEPEAPGDDAVNLLLPIEELSLQATSEGRLTAWHAPSGCVMPVTPVRAFPLTAPERALCLVDERGHEIACIDDIRTVSPELRTLIQADLERREFRPVVQSIDHVEVRTTHSEWQVTTDRGQAKFSLEDEEQVRALGNGRYVVVDQGGTRFIVPNAQKLDKASQRRLHRFA